MIPGQRTKEARGTHCRDLANRLVRAEAQLQWAEEILGTQQNKREYSF